MGGDGDSQPASEEPVSEESAPAAVVLPVPLAESDVVEEPTNAASGYQPSASTRYPGAFEGGDTPTETEDARETELASGLATPIGDEGDQVWVLTPTGEIESVVVFLHGWTATSPFDWHQPWLEHLLDGGSAVVFPRYQQGFVGDDPFKTVDAMRVGLEAGFAHLGEPSLPVVVAGYSHGGSLAFHYATNGLDWAIPVPDAVYSIFPREPIREQPLGDLPDSVNVLVLVGEEDSVVGTEGADAFWEWLATHPEQAKEYRLIHSTPELRAHHEAVKEPVPEARETFWAPLDSLVAKSRPG